MIRAASASFFAEATLHPNAKKITGVICGHRVEDTPEVRRKGWQRIALFGNFFQPGALRQLDASVWIAAARKTPMPELGWAGVFPFTWTVDTPAAFERLSNEGAPFVAPIIQIILSRAPEAPREALAEFDVAISDAVRYVR